MVWPCCQELAAFYISLERLRVLLVQPGYKPSAECQVIDDETAACPRAHELTVDFYERQALRGFRLVEDVGLVHLEAQELSFGDLEAGARVSGAVLFLDRGSDRLSPLVSFYDLRHANGGYAGTNGNLFTLRWAEGTGFGRLFSLATPTSERKSS
jgi:hypothetical protein